MLQPQCEVTPFLTSLDDTHVYESVALWIFPRSYSLRINSDVAYYGNVLNSRFNYPCTSAGQLYSPGVAEIEDGAGNGALVGRMRVVNPIHQNQIVGHLYVVNHPTAYLTPPSAALFSLSQLDFVVLGDIEGY